MGLYTLLSKFGDQVECSAKPDNEREVLLEM